jgi:hypothetical protein
VDDLQELFGPVIHSYTRAEAIADGVLADVTPLARLHGFVVPVALTAEVWAEHVVPSPSAEQLGQSTDARLYDLLAVLRYNAVRNTESEMLFTVAFADDEGLPHDVELKSVIGPGDDGKPVITVMLPNQD